MISQYQVIQANVLRVLEPATLGDIRKKFGMSKIQADALIEHVKKLREEKE